MIDCPRPCHFPCYPCCGVEHRGELSAAAWRANDTRLYISIDTREIRLASIHDHLILHNSLPHPHTYLHSHSIFSQYLYQFLHRANIREYVAYERGDSGNAKSRAGVESVHSEEGRSNESDVASRARPHLSVHLFFSFSLSRRLLSVRLRFDLFDVQNRASRVEATRAHVAPFPFASRFFTAFSISFILSLSLYHENVPVSKSLTTSKARCNKFNAGARVDGSA